jgi:predicted esterase
MLKMLIQVAVGFLVVGASLGLAQDEFANVRSKEFVLAGNPQLKYVMIGAKKPKTPKSGYRVLVVLPGGDGSADFVPFVKRIFQNALNKNYIVIQLIAPKWSSDQVIVWPTRNLSTEGMKVPMEEFAERVLKDVRKRAKLDEKRIYSLAWSSGGPAAYAMGLSKKSSFTGTFAAMSVFKLGSSPLIKNAKGRAFYILHSEGDRVCPYWMAKQAQEAIKDNGGSVRLKTYEGGHGWRGDVFGNIRDGVLWMEKQSAKS